MAISWIEKWDETASRTSSMLVGTASSACRWKRQIVINWWFQWKETTSVGPSLTPNDIENAKNDDDETN